MVAAGAVLVLLRSDRPGSWLPQQVSSQTKSTANRGLDDLYPTSLSPILRFRCKGCDRRTYRADEPDHSQRLWGRQASPYAGPLPYPKTTKPPAALRMKPPRVSDRWNETVAANRRDRTPMSRMSLLRGAQLPTQPTIRARSRVPPSVFVRSKSISPAACCSSCNHTAIANHSL